MTNSMADLYFPFRKLRILLVSFLRKWMKVSGVFFTLWGIGGLLLSCSPVRYVSIETYNPAGITFPQEVKNLLIVNHAVAQPEVPYESTLVNRDDSLKLSADSALFTFCRVLGTEIAASPYFKDVRMLEEGYRKDRYFFSDRMLTSNDVSLLCEEHEVDAVVSLDRLMFEIKESLQKGFDFEIEGWMAIEVSGVIRAYLPGSDAPLSTIEIVDTIYPQLMFDVLNMTTVFVDAEVLLQDAATLVAKRSLVNFIPYWSGDARWYYVSANAPWKEAGAYAASDKWEQAGEKWKKLFDSAADSSWKLRSRLASNLALASELTGDFSKALYWATESFRLLEGRLNENDAYYKLQKMYIDVLKYRILADKRLHIQLKE